MNPLDELIAKIDRLCRQGNSDGFTVAKIRSDLRTALFALNTLTIGRRHQRLLANLCAAHGEINLCSVGPCGMCRADKAEADLASQINCTAQLESNIRFLDERVEKLSTTRCDYCNAPMRCDHCGTRECEVCGNEVSEGNWSVVCHKPSCVERPCGETAWVSELLAATKMMCESLPLYSPSSAAFMRKERLDVAIKAAEKFCAGGSLKSAIGVKADLEHPGNDTGGESAESLLPSLPTAESTKEKI